MTFECDIRGRRRIVSLEPVAPAGTSEASVAPGGRFRVTLRKLAPDGTYSDRTLDLDVRTTDIGMSMIDRATGHVADVTVTSQIASVSIVESASVALEVTEVDPRAAAGATGTRTEGEERVRAPMPGRVLRILVKPGDMVAARQGLIVIEAMKMENELTAVRAGRVREVAVTEGATVEAGRLLVSLD